MARPVKLFRGALGTVFLASAALKSLDPAASALAVGAYDLLPTPAALGVGLLLPGLEAATGAALLTGFLARGAALVAAGLSGCFLLAVASAMLRGFDVSCGCFGPLSAALDAGWWTLAFDAATLLGSIASYRVGSETARCDMGGGAGA
jgi:hypothetical protein